MSAVPPPPGPPGIDPVWAREAENPQFLKAIEQNIRDLETSIQGDRQGNNPVAMEFFEILQKDIDLLRAKNQREGKLPGDKDVQTLNGLNGRLGTLAAEYGKKYHVMFPGINDPVSVPLAQPRTNVGQAFTDDEVSFPDKTELANCSAIRIRGDGHCLFRAIAAHLLTRERLEALRQRRADLERLSPGIGSLIDGALRSLSLSPPVSAVDMLNDPRFSDQWVAALRNLSVNSWTELFQKPDRTLEENNMLAAFFMEARLWLKAGERETEQSVLARYAASMRDMSQANWGGEMECYALSRALGPQIRVINPQLRGRPLLTPGSNPSDIHLLYRPGHFDALFLLPAPPPPTLPPHALAP